MDIEFKDTTRADVAAELLALAEKYRATGYFRAWVTLTDAAAMLETFDPRP